MEARLSLRGWSALLVFAGLQALFWTLLDTTQQILLGGGIVGLIFVGTVLYRPFVGLSLCLLLFLSSILQVSELGALHPFLATMGLTVSWGFDVAVILMGGRATAPPIPRTDVLGRCVAGSCPVG